MYDVIIVGGGLAGLNVAHQLSKDLNILIIESEGHLGGRIYTYHGKEKVVEAGALRFNPTHRLLIALIHDLGLSSNIYQLTEAKTYTDDDVFIPTTPIPPLSLKTILNKIIRASKRSAPEHLRNLTFFDFARSVVPKEECNHLEASFGYSSELVLMNAHDALKLFAEYSQTFYAMKGGLSQIVERLKTRLNHVTVVQDTVTSVLAHGALFEVKTKLGIFTGAACVMAIPVRALEKIDLFRPLHPLLSLVKTSPLCRIYSNVKKKNGLPDHKFTTNSDLRMVIPISPGVVMTSYTDGKYSKRWNKVYKEEGEKGVAKKLESHFHQLGMKVELSNTKFFYWDQGVAYWGVGADSEEIAETILQPFEGKHVYICGSNFSCHHQQWMEGALETSERVIRLLEVSKPFSARGAHSRPH